MKIKLRKKTTIAGRGISAKSVLEVGKDVDRQTADHLIRIGRAAECTESTADDVVDDDAGGAN